MPNRLPITSKANIPKLLLPKTMFLSSLEQRISNFWVHIDITTIRASMGMYLLCKYDSRNNGYKGSCLTGEISDELFGYKYTDFAPDPPRHSKKNLRSVCASLHMYDVLRADRCISVNSLEARVPFGDLDFVRICYVDRPGKEAQQIRQGQISVYAARLRATICRTIFCIVKRRRSPMRWVIPWYGISRIMPKSIIQMSEFEELSVRIYTHAHAVHKRVFTLSRNIRKVLSGSGGNGC